MGHVLVKMALNLAIYLSSCFGPDWVQSMYDTSYCCFYGCHYVALCLHCELGS